MCILKKPFAPWFPLTSANLLGSYKNLYIIKCMDGVYQTQVFTVSCIFKNSFRHKPDFSAERNLCCSHQALAGGNTSICKKHLSLTTLLARSVLSERVFDFRAGLIANHQNYTFWNSSEPNERCPQRLFRALCSRGGRKRERTNTSVRVVLLSIFNGIVTATKTKPIWFLRYKFVGFWFFYLLFPYSLAL